MSALASWVDRRRLVTVVTLTGSLSEATVPDAESVLWECLADMPVAVVIEAVDLTIESAGWHWLSELQRRAADWPGAAVGLTGVMHSRNGHQPVRRHGSVQSAVEALGPLLPTQRRQISLPPDPHSCGQARELVAQACAEWGLHRPKRLAELLISELVANGVVHARTDLVVTVRLRGEALELSVRDQSPRRLPGAQLDPRGFGLQLVAELSDSWGWAPAGRGKVVWSRLPSVG